MSDSTRIQTGNFKAYHVKAQAEDKTTVESKLLMLGDWLYMVNYVNVVDFNEQEKDDLFNSIVIASNSPEQYSGTSPNAEVGYSVLKLIASVLVVAGSLYLFRYFKKIEKNKNNMA